MALGRKPKTRGLGGRVTPVLIVYTFGRLIISVAAIASLPAAVPIMWTAVYTAFF